MARNNPRINEVTLLSAAFIRWGLGLFIFGLIFGYSPLVHHLHGVLEKMGETTLRNAALWLSAALYLIGVVLAYLSILHVTDYKVKRP